MILYYFPRPHASKCFKFEYRHCMSSQEISLRLQTLIIQFVATKNIYNILFQEPIRFWWAGWSGYITRCLQKKPSSKNDNFTMLQSFFYHYCCAATAGSEQQHNQDLKEMYKGRRILEFITFYHNALQFNHIFTRIHCI